MTTLELFLSRVGVLGALRPEQIAGLAQRAVERTYRPDDLILREGDHNRALYLLQSGQLAVQVRRGGSYETVAHLHPGAPFGELSFITGRPCSADIRAVTDAAVILISEDVLGAVPEERRLILEGLVNILAERLHATVTDRPEVLQAPVVLLHSYPNWRAPSAFAAELATSLARQVEWRTLRVDIGNDASSAPRQDVDGVCVATVDASRGPDALRDDVQTQLPAWRRRFACIVLNPEPEFASRCGTLRPLCDWYGHLLGRSDAIPTAASSHEFVAQDSEFATLTTLSGREQLIADVAAAEKAHAAGQPVGSRFRRTVDSIARCVAQLQVGLALGGGGAWGWAHVGVLRALARAEVPVDVIAGCSMGSLVGALIATERDAASIEQVAHQWRRQFRRLIEYRFWRMQLASERALTRILEDYFGDGLVNRTAVPYWANALDIETAEEVMITDGALVTAVLASMAFPAWLPPISRNSRLLIDAALVDPVPVDLARRMHGHFIVAVNAIGPFKARALQTRFPFRAYDFVSRCLRIVGHEMGRARIEPAADAVLVPDLADTSMLSFDRCAEIVSAGEREAEARLPTLLASYARLRRAAGAAGSATA